MWTWIKSLQVTGCIWLSADVDVYISSIWISVKSIQKLSSCVLILSQPTRVWHHVIGTLGCDMTHYVIFITIHAWFNNDIVPFRFYCARKTGQCLPAIDITKASRSDFVTWKLWSIRGWIWLDEWIILKSSIIFGCGQTFVSCGTRPLWTGTRPDVYEVIMQNLLSFVILGLCLFQCCKCKYIHAKAAQAAKNCDHTVW